MATRGAKPKPAHLRLIDGTHNVTRHGKKGEARAQGDEEAARPAQKPRHLKGEASKAWDRYIAGRPWIDENREVAAIAFCELYAEFRESPRLFVAAKHAQLRAYMSELGLTDERNRVVGDDGKGKEDPAAKYLNR